MPDKKWNEEAAALIHYSLLNIPIDDLRWQGTDGKTHPLEKHRLFRAAKDILRGNKAPGSGDFESLCKSVYEGWRPKSHLSIAINHHAECVITDGLHRAIAAKAAGLVVLPARIVYRSEEWIAFKYAMLRANEGKLPIYQPVDHPDFTALGWTVHRTDTARRVEVIVDDLKKNYPNAYSGWDFACNTGVLTLGLANAGYKMLGVDINEDAIHAATSMANMKRFGPAEGVFFGSCTPKFQITTAHDFAVILSFLNHHMADPTRHEYGHDVFRSGVKSAPVVYLDAPTAGDPIGGSSKYIDPNEVFEWCRESGAPGEGRIVAKHGDDLSRTILAWER